jgi:hypothetical protein
MSRTLVALALSALFCVSACENEKVPEPASKAAPVAAPGSSAAAVPSPGAATTAAAVAAVENIPVAADFEDEAEKSITKANYKTELSSLEAEIK